MRISQRQEGDTVLLSLSGRLDTGTAPVLINAISGALERLRAKRQPETGEGCNEDRNPQAGS